MQTDFVTAESVTEGHPDKLCDQISDGILDAYLAQDPLSRVALETMASKDTLFIAGEVTSRGRVDVEETARRVAGEIGYTSPQSGLDSVGCLVLTNIHQQSADIARGVQRKEGVIGAGDQGIMYGFACNESETYMPLPHYWATRLCMRLTEVRKNGTLPWLYPDGKSQVTMRYDAGGTPGAITSVVVSAHHRAEIPIAHIREEIRTHVIEPVIGLHRLGGETKVHINPTGSFAVGGPLADTGLTGRKLMVDTYGGIGKHGGGAFSGKDPTKVDRSAAYMARYIAKNVVAAGLAGRCEVALAYAIGRPEPEALSVRTFGTEKVSLELLRRAVQEEFSCSVGDILTQLNLRRPQYARTAAYGHFGREDQDFYWERTDRTARLLARISGRAPG